ncbi:hypothetical protein RJT34_20334 [Clitoria ternatea]|uniref:Uncharacterized protein n=1 Tax=Clitoria ternatea TaxID=43366 RepID=A0AAN9P5P2_CLITE
MRNRKRKKKENRDANVKVPEGVGCCEVWGGSEEKWLEEVGMERREMVVSWYLCCIEPSSCLAQSSSPSAWFNPNDLSLPFASALQLLTY